MKLLDATNAIQDDNQVEYAGYFKLMTFVYCNVLFKLSWKLLTGIYIMNVYHQLDFSIILENKKAKIYAYTKKLMKQMAQFTNKNFPQPSDEAVREWQHKVWLLISFGRLVSTGYLFAR